MRKSESGETSSLIRKSQKPALDDFNESVVRRIIRNVYISEKNDHDRNIYAKLVKSINFERSFSSLRKIVLHSGLAWK
jgi:hypothetical protein